MDATEKAELKTKISQLNILITKPFVTKEYKSKYKTLIRQFEKKLKRKGD